MHVDVVLTNEDTETRFSEWTEEYDGSAGELFREARGEYGRCVSSVYVDQKNGPPKRVGWFFVSRQEYEDWGHDTYLRGAWVMFRD